MPQNSSLKNFATRMMHILASDDYKDPIDYLLTVDATNSIDPIQTYFDHILRNQKYWGYVTLIDAYQFAPKSKQFEVCLDLIRTDDAHKVHIALDKIRVLAVELGLSGFLCKYFSYVMLNMMAMHKYGRVIGPVEKYIVAPNDLKPRRIHVAVKPVYSNYCIKCNAFESTSMCEYCFTRICRSCSSDSGGRALLKTHNSVCPFIAPFVRVERFLLKKGVFVLSDRILVELCELFNTDEYKHIIGTRSKVVDVTPEVLTRNVNFFKTLIPWFWDYLKSAINSNEELKQVVLVNIPDIHLLCY